MTTGINVGHTAAEQFAYIARLSEAGVVALAFDTGIVHPEVPGGIVAAADEHDFPVLSVPEETPFIAITRAVIDEVTADQLRVIQRIVTQQEMMARAAVKNGIPSVVADLSRALSATVVALGTDGVALAAAGADTERVRAVALETTDLGGKKRSGRGSRVIPDGEGMLLLQSLDVIQPLRGYLAVRADRSLSPSERVLISHAASLIWGSPKKVDTINLLPWWQSASARSR